MNHGDDDEPVEMRAKVIQDELPPWNSQTHREEEDDDFCVCLFVSNCPFCVDEEIVRVNKNPSYSIYSAH
jgi:hypothetical protein